MTWGDHKTKVWKFLFQFKPSRRDFPFLIRMGAGGKEDRMEYRIHAREGFGFLGRVVFDTAGQA